MTVTQHKELEKVTGEVSITRDDLRHASAQFQRMRSFFDYLSQMCDAMSTRCDKMVGEHDE